MPWVASPSAPTIRLSPATMSFVLPEVPVTVTSAPVSFVTSILAFASFILTELPCAPLSRFASILLAVASLTGTEVFIVVPSAFLPTSIETLSLLFPAIVIFAVSFICIFETVPLTFMEISVESSIMISLTFPRTSRLNFESARLIVSLSSFIPSGTTTLPAFASIVMLLPIAISVHVSFAIASICIDLS